MFRVSPILAINAALALQLVAGCTQQSGAFVAEKPRNYPTDSVATTAHRVGVVQGFYGPESVRYSPDQDAYFVSVMNGPGSKKDNNGYIVQLAGDSLGKGKLLAVGGKNGVTLDAPKGLAIHGDTLWAADIDVLRAFNRFSGKPLGEIDLSGKGAVLLNDVAVGPDGTIYVTDTGIIMSEIGSSMSVVTRCSRLALAARSRSSHTETCWGARMASPGIRSESSGSSCRSTLSIAKFTRSIRVTPRASFSLPEREGSTG